ncbi:hypothetical protein PSNTI_12560 [Stutzerimonas stutzeri]|nr:hypothetical protein PSNTI_12560 [Stutzerimonas stutzeri]
MRTDAVYFTHKHSQNNTCNQINCSPARPVWSLLPGLLLSWRHFLVDHPHV